MKFLGVSDPPANMKNALAMDSAKKAKIGKAMEARNPVSASFARRKGYLVIVATSQTEIATKIAPVPYLLEGDASCTRVAFVEGFEPTAAAMGAEAEKSYYARRSGHAVGRPRPSGRHGASNRATRSRLRCFE